ncbi:hypothetical protein [Xanthomonas translucens]|uniref:hypothetical protein n=1 Tax=Xanthomonas campestris pv. translucens TaxID=343 RepID=UPI00083B9A0B|nr:hypothetical protein [Xanthomonas translucens]UJB16958.1 hypothetical protein LTC53_02805 [Xanthomonas translucens pv. undulosa]
MARANRQPPQPPAQKWWQTLSFKRAAAEVSAVLVLVGGTYGFVQYMEVKPLERRLAEAQAAACKPAPSSPLSEFSLLPGDSRVLWDGALTVANAKRGADGTKTRLQVTPREGASVERSGLSPGDSFEVPVAGQGTYQIYLKRSTADFIEVSVLHRP